MINSPPTLMQPPQPCLPPHSLAIFPYPPQPSCFRRHPNPPIKKGGGYKLWCPLSIVGEGGAPNDLTWEKTNL